MTKSELPLRCEVVGDELVFRIGIDTLAWAAEHCPKFDDYEPKPKVVDARELANDVANAINDEAEDGTTPLHLLLDDAIEAAFENGSEGFADDTFD